MQRRFYLKILLLCSPFILMGITYFMFDPFMVLHKYKRYDVVGAYLNEAVVGWDTYTTYRDSLGYDSFIMGNSCTVAFKTQEWEKYLDGGVAIRFYDNSESLGGVSNKLEILSSKNVPIKNVLIVLDPRSLRDHKPSDTFKHILPPEASGMSEVQFQLKFLQGYMYPNIIIPYLHYKITGEVTPYMLHKYIVCPYIIREAYTNNGFNPNELAIDSLGGNYWKNTAWVHTNEVSETGYYKPEIFHEQASCLKTIRAVCDKHGADLKFILSPHYGVHIKTNPDDLAKINEILGEECVFDFTGDEDYISDPHEYYESDHYRPNLGERILKYIYSDKQSASDQSADDIEREASGL